MERMKGEAAELPSFRFLVVDDSEFARRNMKKILTSVEARRRIRHNGREAIEQYVKLKPDLGSWTSPCPRWKGWRRCRGF
jgi:PleD family two-component response regulator